MKTTLQDIRKFLGYTRNYDPGFNPPVRFVLKSKWNIFDRLSSLFSPTKILDKYYFIVTERIIELPFVHRTLRKPSDGYVLEFGSTDSKLALELASLGYRMVGIDLRPWFLKHPNLRLYQGDIFNTRLEEAPFDAIIAVSAIEHVGLGAYGEPKRTEDRVDYQLTRLFYELLVPDGQLIMTVPFGKRKITPRYRIYDSKSLHEILIDFDIVEESYYSRENYSEWHPTTASVLEQIDWEPKKLFTGSDGVVCLSANRK